MATKRKERRGPFLLRSVYQHLYYYVMRTFNLKHKAVRSLDEYLHLHHARKLIEAQTNCTMVVDLCRSGLSAHVVVAYIAPWFFLSPTGPGWRQCNTVDHAIGNNPQMSNALLVTSPVKRKIVSASNKDTASSPGSTSAMHGMALHHRDQIMLRVRRKQK